jgi:SAM-dependent methyltransferase
MAPSGDGGDWFAAEEFWVRFYPFMFADAHFAAAIENLPKIISLTGVSGGSVLDLACGPGRYAVPFAQAGFRVTGVDCTRFLLDKGRERARQAGVAIEWIEADMRDFVRPAAFDLALNVYTSFGYFDDADENRRVLENIWACLKPGGTFFFEHIGKELIAGKFQPTQADTLPDGSVMIQRRRIIDELVEDRRRLDLVGGRACQHVSPAALALFCARDPRPSCQRRLSRHCDLRCTRRLDVRSSGATADRRRSQGGRIALDRNRGASLPRIWTGVL